MIEVSDLRVDYDDFCAVRDLSLTIGDGEVCGLIGPNGAGKTSTMRAIVGLLEPTYGSIRVGGIDARERPDDAQRTMGFMPDFAPVYEDLKCWEFLDIFAAAYKIPKAIRKQRVEEELARVSLTEKRDVPAGTRAGDGSLGRFAPQRPCARPATRSPSRGRGTSQGGAHARTGCRQPTGGSGPTCSP